MDVLDALDALDDYSLLNITDEMPTNSTLECKDLGGSWKYYVILYILIYLTILFVSALIVLSNRLLLALCKIPSLKFVSHYVKLRHYIRARTRQLISGHSLLSKTLITVTLLCNVVYIILAMVRSQSLQDEVCLDNFRAFVELLVVIELMIFAVLRMLSCDNFFTFWFQLYTLVDFLTLSHVFIAILFGVDWIGFRFLRFLWLTQFIVVIQFFSCIRTQNAIDVIKLLVYFIIMWFVGSGMLQFIEFEGDFWRGKEGTQPKSLINYSYLVMVTIVGYGDFSPATNTGKAYLILFIIISVALFVTILPRLLDIVTLLYSKHQYAHFDSSRVPQHVIVCGHLTAAIAAEFLGGFLHHDKGDSLTHVLFLHPQKPDSDFQNVLRANHTRVQFLRGSALKSKDLLKARALNCTTIIILANKQANSPDEEDLANILRVISVKNTAILVPVIVQFLESSSKMQVSKVKGWVSGRDIALCLNELKLGLLANSCLCPGFSTLIANLFYNSEPTSGSYFKRHIHSEWEKNYDQGASNEVYPSIFSQAFDGMTFHDAARVCSNKLGLVLFAVESIEPNFHKFYVNPSLQRYPNLRISTDKMLGYFITQDHSHVSTVRIYCECCPENKHKSAKRRQQQREQQLILMRRTIMASQSRSPVSKISISTSDATLDSQHESHSVDIDIVVPGKMSTVEDNDSTISAALVTGSHTEQEICKLYTRDPLPLDAVIFNPTSENDLHDHIILCIFADDSSPLLGLQNFFKSLRSKHLPPESIKPVVIICKKAFIEKEWPNICDVPKVYVVLGSPLLWSNLVTAGITNCSVCVILSALQTSSGDEEAMDDKQSIFCGHSIQSELHKLNKEIFIITDLRRESNVQFLDFGNEKTPDERIYKSQPFASGEAFSVFMFDSVTSSVFHGLGALYFIENLLNSEDAMTDNPSQLISKPISDTVFFGTTFREFYNAQLEESKICIGLFRRQSSYGNRRYVITSPPLSLVLLNTDIAFILD